MGKQVLNAVEAEEFISKLCHENRRYYEDPKGRGALKDLQQTFPSPWLYVAELIQNAVDAQASCISFQESEQGTLILEHNGKAFDERDVEGICTKGVSSKGAGTVGFMGVGFKAVFRSFETVKISSGPWCFQLQAKIIKGEEYGDKQRDWLGAVLPCWISDSSKPSNGFTCRFELAGRLEDLPPIFNDFKAIFHDNQSLMALLALRGVDELNLFGTSCLLSATEERTEGSQSRYLIEALDSKSGKVRQWRLFRSCYTPSRDAVRRFLEHRQINPVPEDKEKVYAEAARERHVEIFFPLDEEGCPNLPNHGEAYALLPTNQEIPLGININADWLLTVTRTDFMDLGDGTSAWQAEIRAQLPVLFKEYLEWLGSDEGPNCMNWENAYRIFPETGEQQEEAHQSAGLGKWLLHDKFLADLKDILRTVPFLPDMGDKEEKFEFLSPLEGRLLPKPLAAAFEDGMSLCPWDLFPKNSVSTRILGERARYFLATNEIIREFTGAELASYWSKDKIASWYETLEEDKRFDALYTFLYAINQVNDRLFSYPDFAYLPTEEGGWNNQIDIVRYPSDWNILVNEKRLPEMLQNFVSQGKSLLDRQFENFANRKSRSFWDNIVEVEQPTLDEVVERWWQSLINIKLSNDQVDDIVRFTCWVQEKQITRRSLVSYLLTKTAANDFTLLPPSEVLLEEPYAGAYRKYFFPMHPIVSELYFDNSSKDADWKNFFEGTYPRPIGRFHLEIIENKLSRAGAKTLVGDDLPDTRVTYYRDSWDKFPSIVVGSDQFTNVNFTLPDAVQKRLSDSIDVEYFRSFGYWLDESPGQLREFVAQRLLYIPYGCSYIAEKVLTIPCKWVCQLNEMKWVVAKDGSGPYRPRDILKHGDLSRPEMPIADLSPNLIKVLEQANILFESDVPQAEAIKRLQYEGPTASLDRLVELLNECTDSIENQGASTRELEQILQHTPIFNKPDRSKFVDGASRVSGTRLVLKSGAAHRSDLGWLCTVENYLEGSIEKQIFNLAKPYLEIPNKTTWSQSMDFLEWVWAAEPDVESIRQTLPRAYSYIAEDLKLDATAKERWEIVRTKARVFTAGRTWQKLHAEPPVFFDDLGSNLRIEIVPKNQLATAGHLGVKQKDSDIPDGVSLLELPVLSSRYSLQSEPASILSIPKLWGERFEQIETFLSDVRMHRENLPEDDSQSDEETEEDNLATLTFQYLSQISRKVVCRDTGEPIKKISSWAERSGNIIRFSGAPSDFAAELSILLIKAHGFKPRGDNWLSAELVVLLVLLDSTEFSGHLLSLRKKLGLTFEDPPSQDMGEHDSDDAGKTNQEEDTGTSPGPSDEADGDDRDEDEDDDGGGGGDEDEGEEDVGDPPGGKSIREQRSKLGTPSGGSNGGKEGPSSGKKGVPGTGSGSHTPQDRERKMEGLMKRLNELKALGVKADLDDDNYEGDTNDPVSDIEYRDAVLAYERQQGRYPILKESLQKGHDIDSFTDADGDINRCLVRRIEVKGRKHAWEGDETVELSETQFRHALLKLNEENVRLSEDFDYWVYIVEKKEDGKYRILPVKNPAITAHKFELRGGTWGHFVEREGLVDLDANTVKQVQKPIGRSILDLKSIIKKTDESDDD